MWWFHDIEGLGAFFLAALPKVFPSSARLKMVYLYHFNIPAGGGKMGKEKNPIPFKGMIWALHI